MRYAERQALTILSTDVKEFGGRAANVPILVAPQDVIGGAVRSAVARLETMAFDPAESGPGWRSAL